MKDQIKNPGKTSLSLEPQELLQFFLMHLNKIYCAKSHLVERLPELADQAEFRDLKNAIMETRDDIGKQIARIAEIFVLLDSEPSLEDTDEMFSFVEEGFNSIYEQRGNTRLRDLSILFYMSMMESIELASFQILLMAAVKLPYKQITQLLQENFDESKADRVLFLQITSKYIN